MARPMRNPAGHARTRYGWECDDCGDVTLEYRGERVMFCPGCDGSNWKRRLRVYEPTKAGATRG